jgi:hypothetical protein
MNEDNNRLGAMIDLAILKSDGTMVNYGKRHNIVGDLAWSTNRLNLYGRTLVVQTRSELGSYLVNGTFTLSGRNVYRQTGDVFMNAASAWTVGDLVFFPSGFSSYVTSRSINLSVIQLATSGINISTPSQIIRYKTNTTGFGDYVTSPAPVQSLTLTVLLSTNPNTITTYLTSGQAFAAATTAYSISTISLGYTDGNSGGTVKGAYLDVIPPIDLAIGDALVIQDFRFSTAFDIGLPRPTSVCLSGLDYPCQIQRFMGLNQDFGDPLFCPAPNRIWLMDESNKVPLLSTGMRYMTTNVIASMSTINLTSTPVETIIASTLNTTSQNYTNDAIGGVTIYGMTAIGGTIKQIVFGVLDTTKTPKNVIYGVIEYDTPVVIPVDKVITIGTLLYPKVV